MLFVLNASYISEEISRGCRSLISSGSAVSISMADDMFPSILKLVFDQYGILEAYSTCRAAAALINTVTVVVIDYL